MLTSAEGLSKFAEGVSSHYVQSCFFPLLFTQFLFICFPVILCTVHYFSLYSLYNFALYNYDFPFVSSSGWNKN